MNWKVVIKYTITVFIIRFIFGFTEGLLFEPSLFVENSFRIASFLVCVGIFFHLGSHQLNKPHVHAWVVFTMDFAAGIALGLALYPWIGVVEFVDVLLGIIMLIFTLIIGTSFGVKFRQKSKMPEMS